MSGNSGGTAVPPARRYWFALLVCGVALALSLPLYLTAGFRCGGVSGIDGMSCTVGIASPQGILDPRAPAHPDWLRDYWLLALVVGIAVIARWYRRNGATARVVAPLVVALGLATTTVTLTRAGWTGIHSPSAWAESAYLLVFNGATPLLVIAPMLLVLALTERSPALGLFALAYGALCYLFATYDALYLFHQLGLPVDEMNDPAGIRQLLNLAVPALVLLLAARIAHLAGRRTVSR
jgi:hypothetical protein